MDWTIIIALGGALGAFAGVFMALVGVTRLGAWLAFRVRTGNQPAPSYEKQMELNVSQPVLYPVWKTVLWFLGILAYLWATAWLSLLVMFNHWFWSVISPLGFWAFYIAPVFIWISLLAAAAWQLVVHGHKAAGWILAGMTIALALLLVGAMAIFRPWEVTVIHGP